MKTAILSVVVLLMLPCFVGCGEQAVPGGTARIHVGKDGYDVITNRDTSINSLKLTAPGAMPGEAPIVLDVQGYSGNGSTLGGQQMQWSIVESNNRALVLNQLIEAIARVAPLFMQSGAAAALGGNAGVGDTTAQATTRADMLARIAACPFMADAQKAALTALVKAAPGSTLAALKPSIDAALIQVTP